MPVNKIKIFFIIVGLSFLMIQYTNCSSDVGFSSVGQETTPSTSGSSGSSDTSNGSNTSNNEQQPDNTTDNTKDIVTSSCETTEQEQMSFNVRFPDPGYTCEWGKNGNLNERNQYFQARIEQAFHFDLPMGSKICDIDFSFPEQKFLYDDHFLMTFNEMVIASSFDFSQSLDSKDNLLGYEWSKLAGSYWDTSKEGVYCAATSDEVSMCSWPKSDTLSTIALSYPDDVFQTIMAQDISRVNHEFKFITLGDNDSRDCEHSDVEFTFTVNYVK